MVGLSKDGPIYSHEWSPSGKEFAVIYGYMPAKATLFNSKSDPIFEFGTGPRSLGLFNSQGNILMIGGFGNLRGKVEMWDVSNGKSCDKLSEFDAPDTTDVKWSPDGQHIMTSSCAPRLRVGNGYKVWHYSGSLIHEIALSAADELWEVDWQPSKSKTFKASKRAVEGIASSQPQASKQAYRPPGARGSASTFKLHDNDELPQNQAKKDPENMSKAAIKNMKRKEAAKKKRDEEEAALKSGRGNSEPKVIAAVAATTGDPEKDKKLRKLNDKLASIQKLKQDEAEGKKLEANQLEKIKTETAILKDIQILKELKELKL
jgi:translation initiation factor 2A